ncbi:MAG: hypothetical protein ABR511_00105 [Acidimicrobiales bacterium]
MSNAKKKRRRPPPRPAANRAAPAPSPSPPAANRPPDAPGQAAKNRKAPPPAGRRRPHASGGSGSREPPSGPAGSGTRAARGAGTTAGTADKGSRPGDAADPTAGLAIRRASWAGTAAFAATAVAASFLPSLEAVAFAVAVALFLAGCVLFFAAYARGVGRSRNDEVAVTSLFLLAGSAPSPVQWSLLGSLGAEVGVALGTAIGRPYTSLAAGTLVPLYGLALCGLWAARHGAFPPRHEPVRRSRR